MHTANTPTTNNVISDNPKDRLFKKLDFVLFLSVFFVFSKQRSALTIQFRPILYIGPEQSHVGDILKICLGNISVEHNQTEILVKELLSFASLGYYHWDKIGSKTMNYINEYFLKEKLINQFISQVKRLL